MNWSKSFLKKVAKVNRDLAALEKAGLATASPSYRTILELAMSQPNAKGSIYRVIEKDGEIQVRLQTPSKIEKLPDKIKGYYMREVGDILEHKTSSVSGVRKWQREKFKNFKEQLVKATEHPVLKKDGTPKMGRSGNPIYSSPYKNLTEDQYKEMMRVSREFISDKNSKYTSQDINEAQDHLDILQILQDGEDLEQIMEYYLTDRFDMISLFYKL